MIVKAALALLAASSAGVAVYLLPTERPVSAYATSIRGRTRAQRYNTERALNLLNGAEIKPGQTFSFNKRVGSYARDDGYRKAPVSYNGQLIDSWGGGVCQASTTLYNAALLAGMKVVERHRHEFCPSYVAPGRDAAVAYNDIDLKFENPWPFPVKIAARADGNSVHVELTAMRPLPTTVSVAEHVKAIEKPAEFSFGARGPMRIRNTGKPGYDVAVYRYAGSKEELVSFDSYPAMNRVVQYGE